MDVSGEKTLDIDHNIVKKPLDHKGSEIGGVIQHDLGSKPKLEEKKVLETANSDTIQDNEANEIAVKRAELDPSDPRYCGSCYGAELSDSECCNTCAEVERAYQKRGWAFQGVNSVEQVIAFMILFFAIAYVLCSLTVCSRNFKRQRGLGAPRRM